VGDHPVTGGAGCRRRSARAVSACGFARSTKR
jgi:hypothetical protein